MFVHRNKAVADGAISYYVDHLVSVRSARFTYGIEVSVDFDNDNAEHRQRSDTTYTTFSGETVVPGFFSAVLPQVDDVVTVHILYSFPIL